MLSNIVLNELDQELERRGLHYARWADDFVILVGSRRAAERVMASVIGYLEEEFGLPVNRDKSTVARIEDVTFLGFRVQDDKINIISSATVIDGIRALLVGLIEGRKGTPSRSLINKPVRGWSPW